VLPPELRELLGLAIKERLERLGALLVCIAVCGQHVHLLAEMPINQPRAWMGIAKKHGWFALRARGWTGKLWGKRSKAVCIRDRQHQLNAYRYIVRHAEQGAWVWSITRKK
jgi:hypothetical protein